MIEGDLDIRKSIYFLRVTADGCLEGRSGILHPFNTTFINISVWTAIVCVAVVDFCNLRSPK